MTDAGISLLAIYDRVASVDTKVEALSADVRAQLAHGQRQMDDHEERLRKLESASDQRRGMSGVLTVIVSLAGSSGASALISYLLRGHP